MATRKKATFEQRVAEYVDSQLMTQRIRHGKFVAARIRGNFGSYRTQVNQAKKIKGECTCPSEVWPCKHVHALRATWEANPESFFDVDAWLKNLAKEPRETLIEAIQNIVTAAPEFLSVFGIPGFENEDEEDAEYYG